jgi:hypothetical protein
MKTLEITEMNSLIAKYLEDPNQQPVILTLKKKPLAVVLPTHGDDVESISLSFSPKFLAIMERSKLRMAKEGGISSEEMRRQFGLKPYKESKPKAKTRKTNTKGRKVKVIRAKRNGKQDGSQV